ncbi:MAG: type II toxin-antitoxin system prevent-host-death family antitoxin [Bryobacteraceae bacterium]|nr:type II toxin-antitoxin system prevent-host-death family antitoxin [Bryobacteraceae bacterium]
MEQINVSEFKAVCLRLLEEVRQTGEPIEVLKNGEPLVVVHPARPRSRKGAFGVMKSTLLKPAGDIVQPLEDVEWEAMRDS